MAPPRPIGQCRLTQNRCSVHATSPARTKPSSDQNASARRQPPCVSNAQQGQTPCDLREPLPSASHGTTFPSRFCHSPKAQRTTERPRRAGAQPPGNSPPQGAYVRVLCVNPPRDPVAARTCLYAPSSSPPPIRPTAVALPMPPAPDPQHFPSAAAPSVPRPDTTPSSPHGPGIPGRAPSPDRSVLLVLLAVARL